MVTLSLSLFLSFFLPGLGVACDLQALGTPDHRPVCLVVGFGVLLTAATSYIVGESLFLSLYLFLSQG